MATIHYQYDNNSDAMGFSDSKQLSIIDYPASMALYERMVENVLKYAYPEYDIEITTGYGKVEVIEDDGSRNDSLIAWIEDEIHEVWQSFEWILTKAHINAFGHEYILQEDAYPEESMYRIELAHAYNGDEVQCYRANAYDETGNKLVTLYWAFPVAPLEDAGEYEWDNEEYIEVGKRI